MEWLDGVSVREVVAIDAMRHRPEVLADELLRSAMQQMFVDGHFHADLHPGNVLVSARRHARTHRLRRDRAARPVEEESSIREMMFAVSRQDAGLLRQAVLEVATVRRGFDDDLFERAISRFMSRNLGPGSVPSAAMFNELLQLFFSFGLTLPTGVQHLLPGDDHARGDAPTLQPGVPRHRGVAASRRGVDPATA